MQIVVVSCVWLGLAHFNVHMEFFIDVKDGVAHVVEVEQFELVDEAD